MGVSIPRLRRCASAVALSGMLAAVGLVMVVPSAAQAAEGDVIATGSDWEITQVSGGYEVTKELDSPLPTVSDIPTIEVDGVSLGTATEAADGLSLSVLTSEDLASATDVKVVWSNGTEPAEPTNSAVTSTDTPVKAVSSGTAKTQAVQASDGATPGPYAYLEDDYDFGDQAIDLAAIGGIRGEMTGRLYVPVASGQHPTVVILHGRHTSCAVPTGGGSVSNPNRWPCISPQVDIPSYKGYEVLAQTLASNGYSVISISANAINSNDNQLALDYGAQARGQLILDTLTMLDKANMGKSVSYYDAASDTTVDLDTALAVDTAAKDLGSTPTSGTNPGDPITSANLVGKFDLQNVGLMGHSRGGEGVVSAVNLNQALDSPFGIKSVLPLAPVDFGRETATDTNMLVILPYCDGDVSNQQGQHFSDDSRYANNDNALRSTVWVMGANHNFFNSVWTPGKYSLATSDDWGANSTDSVCGPASSTNVRLSADDEYNTGVALMSAWFQLTLGGKDEFLALFDGSADPELSSVPAADLWTTATAPASARQDIETFTTDSGRVRLYGSATAAICASAGLRTSPQSSPACATASTLRSTSGMPHWTPASFAPNVPASPMTKFLWTAATGAIRVTVPKESRDASGFDALTFKTAPDESVLTGTDMTVSVVDGSGATWSSPVSALNSGAVNRLPASGSTTLNKIVLQQVSIPIDTLSGTIDVSDIREVRFTAGSGADGTVSGGVYLADLALMRSAVGTTQGLSSEPTVNVSSTRIEEGSGVDEARVAVVLDKPSQKSTSAWFTLIGSTAASGKAGLAAQKVTFAPGETCKAVSFTTYGNSDAGTTATTSYKIGVSAPENVIVGANQFGNLTIREDDGFTNSTTAAPEVGVQGDVCAEYAAKSATNALATSASVTAPGATVTLTGSGYRSGESVSFSEGSNALGSAIANSAGEVTLAWPVAEDAALGAHSITATGSGSGRYSAVEVSVKAPTSTELTLSPEVPAIKQSVTLTANLTGADVAGEVEFFDGTTSLGTVTASDGQAVLVLPDGFLAGSHSLSASFAETATAAASTSATVAFTLAKGTSTTMVTLSSTSVTYGTGATGTVLIGGVSGGTATVSIGATTTTLTLDANGHGSFAIPATLAVGTYPVSTSYSGSDFADPSASSAVFTVTKAAARVSVTAPKKVKKGKKFIVKISVAGVSGAQLPSGKVTIKSGKKTLGTITIAANGKTVSKKITLSAKGSKKVTVTYLGNASYLSASQSATVKVTKKK